MGNARPVWQAGARRVCLPVNGVSGVTTKPAGVAEVQNGGPQELSSHVHTNQGRTCIAAGRRQARHGNTKGNKGLWYVMASQASWSTGTGRSACVCAAVGWGCTNAPASV